MMTLTLLNAGAFASQTGGAELAPFIFAGVSGAAAVACGLAALSLARQLSALRADAARAERRAASTDLTLERIFEIGADGALRPATSATEDEARAVAAAAKAEGRGSERLVDLMFGRDAVRKLGPLLEGLALDGRSFELRAEDATGAPTLYIGDLVGARALLRVWPEIEPPQALPTLDSVVSRAAPSALASAPIGVLVFDAGARLIFINIAARRLLGLRAERLDGAPSLRAVIDGLREAGRVPERPDFAAWRAEVLADPPEALSRDGLWILGDGDALRITAERLGDDGFIAYVQDETSAVGLERRYRIALGARRATLAAIEEGIAVIGADGKMQLVNPAFARLWDAPAALCDERAAGEASFADLMRAATEGAQRSEQDLWRRIDAALRAPAPRQTIAFEADARGETRLDVSATPLPDGATLLVMRDVTAAHLGAAALRDRAARLEEADGLKTEFLNTIAYQLRTPLNAALGFTDMLLRDMAGPLDEKQREYARCAFTATEELREIVADALDLGALAGGSVELARAPLDLGAAIHAVATAIEPRAARRGAAFRAEAASDPAPFMGDEQRLRHAFFAVGAAALSGAEPTDSLILRYWLEADGAFTEDNLAIIEIALIRGHPESAAADQLAEDQTVALRLARRIVEAHGGAVVVASSASGATARFEFPLSAAYTHVDLDPSEPDQSRTDAA